MPTHPAQTPKRDRVPAPQNSGKPKPPAKPEPAPASAPQSEPQPTPVESASAAPPDASGLWSQAIDAVSSSVRTQSMLSAATPISYAKGELTVEIAGPMRAVLTHRTEEIERLLRRLAGQKVTLTIREPKDASHEPTDLPPDAKTLAEQHPLVQEAMKLFNGRVERAHPRRQD